MPILMVFRILPIIYEDFASILDLDLDLDFDFDLAGFGFGFGSDLAWILVP